MYDGQSYPPSTGAHTDSGENIREKWSSNGTGDDKEVLVLQQAWTPENGLPQAQS
jgi:hypothetical protein